MSSLFKIIAGANFLEGLGKTNGGPVDAQTLVTASEIVNAVRDKGESAVRRYAEKFGERGGMDTLLLGQADMKAAFERLCDADQKLLLRVAKRIENFARAQLDCLKPLDCEITGGRAGHSIEAIERVGCYAPGGRYPLPSTVLMTTVTARVAGCQEIVLASPNPTDMTLAAGHVGGAKTMLPIGGAHAISALAYGFENFTRTDLICGPGNRWVTAAKQLVVGAVGIDMLAGPSELVIVADQESDTEMVAADLLAQAEHDTDARPFLICFSERFANDIVKCLEKLLEDLPTGDIARAALANGAAIVANDMEQAENLCNQLAPEHLELHLRNPKSFAGKIKHAGCIFLGSESAEVLGDYGAGPNHTLPTGGTARWNAGLNVFTFVRARTWLDLSNVSSDLVADTVALAQHEGLIGHARSAQRRMPV